MAARVHALTNQPPAVRESIPGWLDRLGEAEPGEMVIDTSCGARGNTLQRPYFRHFPPIPFATASYDGVIG
jgi:hypothetical protein